MSKGICTSRINKHKHTEQSKDIRDAEHVVENDEPFSSNVRASEPLNN